MPPNSKKEKFPISDRAAPFNDEPHGSGISKPTLVQNGNPSAFISLRWEANQSNPHITVNTTHQYSYELDRYRKNAMLIFHYDDAYDGSIQTAYKVKSTFKKFRFEVEMHHNIDADEVKTISQVFFQRDFTEYGAVGIVVIGNTDSEGVFITSGAKFDDTDILRHMSNANLQNKPKFTVFECDNAPRRRLPVSFVDTDVIDYNFLSSADIPNLQISKPLSILCDKVDRMGDTEKLDVIFRSMIQPEYIKEIERQLVSYYNTHAIRPYLSSSYVNLPKRLILSRNP